MSTTREKALKWWNNLISDGLRAGYAQKHLNSGTRYSSLTGREIEEIYLKETSPLEQKEIMYSEKEVKHLIHLACSHSGIQVFKGFDKWFDKNKK